MASTTIYGQLRSPVMAFFARKPSSDTSLRVPPSPSPVPSTATPVDEVDPPAAPLLASPATSLDPSSASNYWNPSDPDAGASASAYSSSPSQPPLALPSPSSPELAAPRRPSFPSRNGSGDSASKLWKDLEDRLGQKFALSTLSLTDATAIEMRPSVTTSTEASTSFSAETVESVEESEGDLQGGEDATARLADFKADLEASGAACFLDRVDTQIRSARDALRRRRLASYDLMLLPSSDSASSLNSNPSFLAFARSDSGLSSVQEGSSFDADETKDTSFPVISDDDRSMSLAASKALAALSIPPLLIPGSATLVDRKGSEDPESCLSANSTLPSSSSGILTPRDDEVDTSITIAGSELPWVTKKSASKIKHDYFGIDFNIDGDDEVQAHVEDAYVPALDLIDSFWDDLSADAVQPVVVASVEKEPATTPTESGRRGVGASGLPRLRLKRNGRPPPLNLNNPSQLPKPRSPALKSGSRLPLANSPATAPSSAVSMARTRSSASTVATTPGVSPTKASQAGRASKHTSGSSAGSTRASASGTAKRRSSVSSPSKRRMPPSDPVPSLPYLSQHDSGDSFPVAFAPQLQQPAGTPIPRVYGAQPTALPALVRPFAVRPAAVVRKVSSTPSLKLTLPYTADGLPWIRGGGGQGGALRSAPLALGGFDDATVRGPPPLALKTSGLNLARAPLPPGLQHRPFGSDFTNGPPSSRLPVRSPLASPLSDFSDGPSLSQAKSARTFKTRLEGLRKQKSTAALAGPPRSIFED